MRKLIFLLMGFAVLFYAAIAPPDFGTQAQLQQTDMTSEVPWTPAFVGMTHEGASGTTYASTFVQALLATSVVLVAVFSLLSVLFRRSSSGTSTMLLGRPRGEVAAGVDIRT